MGKKRHIVFSLLNLFPKKTFFLTYLVMTYYTLATKTPRGFVIITIIDDKPSIFLFMIHCRGSLEHRKDIYLNLFPLEKKSQGDNFYEYLN